MRLAQEKPVLSSLWYVEVYLLVVITNYVGSFLLIYARYWFCPLNNCIAISIDCIMVKISVCVIKCSLSWTLMCLTNWVGMPFDLCAIIFGVLDLSGYVIGMLSTLDCHVHAFPYKLYTELADVWELVRRFPNVLQLWEFGSNIFISLSSCFGFI